MMAIIRSVNVGRPRPREWAEIGRTAIEKHPVSGPVPARPLGLDGDQVGDTVHHGGVDQAVYAFAREDLDWWAGQLGAPLADGMFGENLTTDRSLLPLLLEVDGLVAEARQAAEKYVAAEADGRRRSG